MKVFGISLLLLLETSQGFATAASTHARNSLVSRSWKTRGVKTVASSAKFTLQNRRFRDVQTWSILRGGSSEIEGTTPPEVSVSTEEASGPLVSEQLVPEQIVSEQLVVPEQVPLPEAVPEDAAIAPIETGLDEVPELPTLTQFQKFALPCLGLWIAGPLLSLVDTAFIGLSGAASESSRQLAALGPATTFFDGATYLFAFLNVATTNLYSSARARYGGDSDEAESVVRTAARVSVRCGVGILTLLVLFCRPLLRLYIGETALATPGLLDSATAYVKIRAFTMPTSLLLGVLQAALLGAKDSVTPLIAIVYSTVVNVIGDFVLVNRLKMGLVGASIATTCAQWAATAALIAPARQKLVRDHKLSIFGNSAASKSSQGEEKELVSSQSFLGFAAPVLTLILGKLAAFGFMTNAAAGVPGQPTPLASHQIILSLLFFCSPFLEVISQTAQTFLPPFLAPVETFLNDKSENDLGAKIQGQLESWKEATQKVATKLLGIGIVTGTAVASLASLVPAYFGFFLTADTVLQQAIKPLAKHLWLGAFAWSFIGVSEGVLLARRELSFLAAVYLISTALLPPAMVRIKLSGQGSVEQVWLAFGVFQVFRALLFTGRIWWGPFLMNLFKSKKQDKTPPADAVPATQ